MSNKGLPPTKKTALELEAEINDILEAMGQPVLYRPTSELLKLATPPLCSFCGRGINQVTQMIPGNDANICDQCVKFCSGMLPELLEQPVEHQVISELLKLATPPLCSFCGRGVDQVAKMIAGNDAIICYQCVMFFSATLPKNNA